MKLKTRKYLFFIFLVAFFLITPLMILTATGYKIKLTWPINLKTVIQKTGLLVIDTEPSGAKIFLNGKSEKSFIKSFLNSSSSYSTTPLKIKQLLPGEYDVRLEIENYWPWEKKLKIEAGQTTFIENIILFKKNLPIQIDSLEITSISSSPNQELLITNSHNQLSLYKNDNKLAQNHVFASSTSIRSIKWSGDNRFVLLRTNENINYLFDIKDFSKKINLNELIGTNIYNLKFGNNSSEIYYQDNESLRVFNINKNTDMAINIIENITDYILKNNYLYVISSVNKQYSLKMFNISTGDKINSIELPCSPEYSLADGSDKNLDIFDDKYHMLYIVNPSFSIKPIREIINDVTTYHWINDNQLLYANEFEIWLSDLNLNKKELITRIGQEIKTITWHPTNNYILYSTNTEIDIIELDNREKRNIIELTKLEEITNPMLSSNGNIIYFGAKIGNQQGLYKLNIQ